MHYLILEMKKPGELGVSKVKVEKRRQKLLDKKYFGEGTTIFKDKEGKKWIYQLVWKKPIIFKYDLDMNLIEEIKRPIGVNQGWGITQDPKEYDMVYITDG